MQRETPGRLFWRRFRKNRLATSGTLIVILLFFFAALAPYISPYDPGYINTKNALQAPSEDHLLGTDQLGRDVLSRMIWGSRISLLVGFVAVGIATVIGAFLGALAGFYGKWVDNVIMRFVDIMLCFPTFFLILAVIAILEPSIWNIMIVIGVTSWMGVTRLVRAEFLSLKERDFVRAAGNGCKKSQDNLSSYLTQCLIAHMGICYPGGCCRNTYGICIELSRHRGSAPNTQLGEYPDCRKRQYRNCLVAISLPWIGYPHHCFGL